MKKNLLLILSTIFIQQANAQCTSCTIPFVGVSQGVGSSSNVSLLKPTGVVLNDVMIASVHSGWCASGSAVTAPAGWTLIANTSNTGPGCGASNTSIQLSTFYKVASASEPSVYIFTGSTSQIYVGAIVAYSGVNITTPINVSGNNGLQEDCSSIVAPSITTTACTRLVSVFFCSVNSSATNIIPQASLTERVDVGTTGNHPWGNENLEISDQLLTSAGSTGIRTAALSTCSGMGWVTGGQLIALNCDISSGININSIAESITVLPNPSSGLFEISMDENSDFVYEIADVVGRSIKKGRILEKKTIVDLSAEQKGIYLIKLSSSKGTVTKKIIVE